MLCAVGIEVSATEGPFEKDWNQNHRMAGLLGFQIRTRLKRLLIVMSFRRFDP